MTVRRTDDSNIFFMEADPVQLWAYGIVEFKIDRGNGKFLMTPIMRDHSEGPVVDATDPGADDRIWSQRRAGRFARRAADPAGELASLL